tara:strand:- start:894 stop:1460 length:567 start_codon:yes stop_codon:yes gene_type:complete
MTQLKKEFNPKDVERIRNLVKGKYGDKTQTSIGYSKKSQKHKEGDVWEENDVTWTIKDGVKQNVTKLDKAKKAYNMPLFCPKCKKIMKNRHDPIYWKIHKTCWNCVIAKEDQLKKEGKMDEYEGKIKNGELDNTIEDFKLYVKEKMEESNTGFVSEAGDVEKWMGKLNKEKVDEYTKEVIEYLESLKV